ncbi:PREDICTED: DNA (cytosine-5)-methyltransferase CMT3 [Tarenaya hassleriana]|uniref:DNA (cytosine-5)-methyltransferase CMT3 n=1 Tax=Tarenaya hassleriana TaxID=28532 RepID=UPI00053C80A1|nr:PREDICTED: DNA (cytosine-5)-methyltransferase CMT3 [Tarenaya hassleriana]
MRPKRRDPSTTAATDSDSTAPSKRPKHETPAAAAGDVPIVSDSAPKESKKRLGAADSEEKSLESVGADGDDDEAATAKFIGEPVPEEEARRRWPQRYHEKKKKLLAWSKKTKEDHNEDIIQAQRHFRQALVDDSETYDLYVDAHVEAGEGEEPYICKIVEMFESVDGTLYFTAQWFYRACDTVIGNQHTCLIDNKRVFFSEIRNTNPLECLLKKLKILMIPLNASKEAVMASGETFDYYCNMRYLLPYSTFVSLPPDVKMAASDSSTISSDIDANGATDVKSDQEEVSQVAQPQRSEVTLLDLYSGCGAMSTGLCFGAQLSGLNLVTRWAVDLNEYACHSLKFNHPETQVRNESAEYFLFLLKEWEKLCIYFGLRKCDDPEEDSNLYGLNDCETDEDEDVDDESGNEDGGEIFEVEKILDICYGDPKGIKKCGLYLKVRWKKYGPSYDSWEPIEGLSNCRERIKEFVVRGYDSKILPLPGDADVLCGGPPCQGISGFNRFRNKENPLADEKNKQLLVYMDIVEYLKPKYVLMENVVDILKFVNGYVGRYAVGRLVQMNYQTRMGMMAAGAYGLPQFRMRFFLWGAQPNERLPPYPLPTHDVIMRGVIPTEFEGNTVAYDEGHTVKLAEKLLLKDAISDLPAVANSEKRDEIPYDKEPETPFQRHIRLSKDEMLGSSLKSKPTKRLLYDHHPLNLNMDDYQRVCQIPKRKGANFRDLTGVRVGPNKKVEFDPNVPRVYLDSGKPLVPDYAMSFIDGTSSKPFGRLWWDETVPTVVTRAEPHNQVIIHPEQDRVLTIRENARLQGFPDFYKLFGPPKEKYIQVGNAVAVPVARALGLALGRAYQGLTTGDDPLLTLPLGFPNPRVRNSSDSLEHVS